MKYILPILIFGSFVFGQAPCEQTYPAIPAGIDVSRIAVNPSSPTKEHLYLGMTVVTAGETAVHDVNACDPEGMPMSITASRPDVAVDVNEITGVCTFSFLPPAGTTYIDISATDTVLEDSPLSNVDDPKTTKGTWVVVAIVPNKPPVLCGGRP